MGVHIGGNGTFIVHTMYLVLGCVYIVSGAYEAQAPKRYLLQCHVSVANVFFVRA